MEDALSRLLSGQILGVVVGIKDEDAAKMVLAVVRSGAMGGHLRGLDVWLESAKSVELLCGAMVGRACRALMELKIDASVKTPDCGEVLSLLAGGACPGLITLILECCRGQMETGKWLAMAIESGHLGQHLKVLELRYCDLGPMGLTLMMTKAMEVQGSLHGLRRLKLDSTSLTREDGEALGKAIGAKAFPHLEELSLPGIMYIGDEGFTAIMEGLEGGGCKELKYLDLENSVMGNMATVAFARALSSGNCHQLQWLNCDCSFQDKQSLLTLLQSIRSISFPHMWLLGLEHITGGEECSILLGEVLKAGTFPCLQRLWIGGQRVYRSVWEAIEAGSCPGLLALDLSFARLDSDSATALVSALLSGSLNQLQHINLGGTKWGEGEEGNHGDADFAGVLNALASSCGGLEYLNISIIRSMHEQASQALVDALRDGKWTNLWELTISGSVATSSELGRVLQEGACPMLRTLELASIPLSERERDKENQWVEVLGALLKERHITVKR